MSLAGKRVVVTRSGGQAKELEELLRKEGAVPVSVPTIAFQPPEDPGQADQAVGRLSEYGLLIFTSANAVGFFLGKARFSPGDARFVGLKVAAIGPKTARALSVAGLAVDVVPEKAGAAEELFEAISERLRIPNLKVLIPGAKERRGILADSLRAAGAVVDVVPFYRTVPSREGRDQVARLVAGERVDWITFASGSAVRAFFGLLGTGSTAAWIRGKQVLSAVIGKVTEGVLLEYGIPAAVTATEPMLEAMVAAMARFEERKNHA